jgi:hypothetical protein
MMVIILNAFDFFVLFFISFIVYFLFKLLAYI